MTLLSRSTFRQPASTQASFVPLREVRENVLSIFAPRDPGQREYRAILRVDGLNYTLKSEQEQRQLNSMFQLFLAGLTHPLQVVMRVLPLQIDRYLSQFHTASFSPFQGPERLSSALFEQSRRWSAQAHSYVQFWQKFASQRTLLERQFYLIIPADSLTGPHVKFLPFVGLDRSSSMRSQDAFARARQQLDLRCSEITRQLSGLGLDTHRLEKYELVTLEYNSLCPSRAVQGPLHNASIDSIDQFITISAAAKGRTPPQNHQEHGLSAFQVELLQHEEERYRQQQQKRRHPSGRKTRQQQAQDVLHWPDLADLIAPAGVLLSADSLYMEEDFARTLIVRALPRYVSPGWLRSLVSDLDEPMDVSWHFVPRDSAAMIQTLQQRDTQMAAINFVDRTRGRTFDPARQGVQTDVQDLISRLASGEEHMLDVSMHVLLRGRSKRELNERTERIRSVLNSMLLPTRNAFFEQDKALRSCLPYARNELTSADNGVFTLPGSIAATFFMFLNSTLTETEGILEGITDGQEPLLFDRWSARWRNPHRLIVAPSGAGKSFKVKEDILRLDLSYNNPYRLLQQRRAIGLQQIIVDVEREFLVLTQEQGGQWVRFAPGSQHHINLFDLPQDASSLSGDGLADQIQFLHGALEMMLAEQGRPLSGAEKALLDNALYVVYRAKGITSNPATHRRQPPLLHDLYDTLTHNVCGPDPTGLAHRLRRFVSGSLAGIFSGQTNVSLDKAIVTLDIHDLDLELRPIALYIISHFVWQACFGSTIPRHFVLDEMHSLYRYAEGKKMIEEMFQRGRKHYLSITGVIQYPAMLVGSPLAANCQMIIIMAQEPSSIDAVAEFAHLSAPQIALVRKCRKGDGLVIIGDRSFFVHFAATDAEYAIATTDPRDRVHLQVAEQLPGDARTPVSDRYQQWIAAQPTDKMEPLAPTGSPREIQGLPPRSPEQEQEIDTSQTDRLSPIARGSLLAHHIDEQETSR